MEFDDRILKCADCGTDFVFTAGEQLFFFDKQFKNDPKRCKLCKAKRAETTKGNAQQLAALPLSRTETRTKCSACEIETTVPFKPTQGRPVLCRSCFQMKRVPSAVAAVATMDSPAGQIAAAAEEYAAANAGEVMGMGTDTAIASVAQVNVPTMTAEMLSIPAVEAAALSQGAELVAAEVADA
jgi:CxxC-x17-CxxC domain-containing protein